MQVWIASAKSPATGTVYTYAFGYAPLLVDVVKRVHEAERWDTLDWYMAHTGVQEYKREVITQPTDAVAGVNY